MRSEPQRPGVVASTDALAATTGGPCACTLDDGIRMASTCKETLSRQAKEHPGRTIALALGAGYLVGGGLFSRLTARALGTGLRMGLRLAVFPLVTQGMVVLAKGLWPRADHGRADSVGPSTRRGA